MLWKEFFKPTKGKVIITISVIVLIFIFPVKTLINSECLINMDGMPPCIYKLFPLFISITYIADLRNPSEIGHLSWMLLALIILAYLFACFIVLVYHSVNKKFFP